MAEKRLQADKNDQHAGGPAPPPPAPPRRTRSPSYTFVAPLPHPQSAEDCSTTTTNCDHITNTNVPLIKTPNSTTVTDEKDKKTRTPQGLRKTTRRRPTRSPVPESGKSYFDFYSSDDDSVMTGQATVIRRPNDGRTKWVPESWKVE